jgi:hypothetical protein
MLGFVPQPNLQDLLISDTLPSTPLQAIALHPTTNDRHRTSSSPVGWVKRSATQHTTLAHHGDDVGFRSSNVILIICNIVGLKQRGLPIFLP